MNVNLYDKADRKKAIAKIDALVANLKKLDEVTKRLAEIGFKVAQSEFLAATNLDNAGVSVKLVKIPNGYQIQADGEAVCYLEFGAGVYYNGSFGNYGGERPAGIDGIGEHDTINDSGVSKGTQKTWAYYDNAGNLIKTHGTYAYQPMFHSLREMERQAEAVIKEVFSKND